MPNDNSSWAFTIVDTLIQLGAHYFVCAPGSRSTPLLMAIASHPQARSCVHFDERGLAFHALGYAKATGNPAIIVVTSGTAVANLLPAIVEADLEYVPLIILTADRPPELRDCGANQTCDQVKLFTNHVRWQADLPCPDPRILADYLVSTISHAVSVACANEPGPVHLNCMFREPLFSTGSVCKPLCYPSVAMIPGILQLDPVHILPFAAMLNQCSEGIILALSEEHCPCDLILALAETLQWPVLTDILSPLRRYQGHPLIITQADLILQGRPQIKANAVIQLGNRMVSKRVSEWLSYQTLGFYLHISTHLRRADPHHLVSHRIQADPSFILEKLLPLLHTQLPSSATTDWIVSQKRCQEELYHFFHQSSTLTEPQILWALQPLLESQWALFLANSMPIRDANQFLPVLPEGSVIVGNRGVAGIDGNIATALGVAQGVQGPTIAILGDLTALHDLNSLAMLRASEHPLIVCIINNSGGGIFSFLPIAEAGEEEFERFIAAAHPWKFINAAKLFDLPYFHPASVDGLDQLFQELIAQPRSCIIEITTSRTENVKIHKAIVERCLRAMAVDPVFC